MVPVTPRYHVTFSLIIDLVSDATMEAAERQLRYRTKLSEILRHAVLIVPLDFLSAYMLKYKIKKRMVFAYFLYLHAPLLTQPIFVYLKPK